MEVKSVKSGKKIYLPDVNFLDLIKDNVLTQEESLELGKNSISEQDLGELNLKNASKLLRKISSTTGEVVWGTNMNTKECGWYGPTSDCYRSSFCWFSKNIAYSLFPRTSEALFGCYNILDSKFSINCYNSSKLTRCFEVSDSFSCFDSYYCYNSENIRDCMFCFNAKSKRYAICNVEIGKERKRLF